jgi:hypothetical protein
MRTLLTILTLSIVLSAGAIAQPYTTPGDHNGWDTVNSPQLVDDGSSGDLVAGDGIFSVLVNIPTAGRYEWKVFPGDWASAWPLSGNSWFYTTMDNEDVLFTFNTNTVGDGWLADGNWPYTDHSDLTYTLVGDLQDDLGDAGDWQNNGTLLLHDDGLNGDSVAGDGYYSFSGNLPAGTWYWKVVRYGTWDAIGADGAGINASNMELVLAAPGVAYFVLDTHLGRLFADAQAPVANEDLNWSTIKELYR